MHRRPVYKGTSSAPWWTEEYATSDGSETKDDAVGYGSTVHRGGQAVARGCDRLGPDEVSDAEATGAPEGFKAALSIQYSSRHTIIVCLDNIATATCLRGKPSDSSQDVFIELQALAASQDATKVRWVPGHAKILGNEADALAKARCLKSVPRCPPHAGLSASSR
ncbi:hypothetical protein S40285_06000 [Stachybotrys chlorohalonatus IBT 40285]|uniref:RNase H type-1 domain-containing protein n=1 Tax=Stachybotrys chlorohalonatus (strain IBT 40285) TaxID=1283841 RepID=A0A084R0M1_STAC4|nr:hypothetical protein S40285_06000 [Stachybotrys chlorohalonata IBT 40285]